MASSSNGKSDRPFHCSSLMALPHSLPCPDLLSASNEFRQCAITNSEQPTQGDTLMLRLELAHQGNATRGVAFYVEYSACRGAACATYTPLTWKIHEDAPEDNKVARAEAGERFTPDTRWVAPGYSGAGGRFAAICGSQLDSPSSRVPHELSRLGVTGVGTARMIFAPLRIGRAAVVERWGNSVNSSGARRRSGRLNCLVRTETRLSASVQTRSSRDTTPARQPSPSITGRLVAWSPAAAEASRIRCR